MKRNNRFFLFAFVQNEGQSNNHLNIGKLAKIKFYDREVQ